MTSGGLVALMPAQDLLTLIRHAGYVDDSIPVLLEKLRLPRTLLTDPRGFVEPQQVWGLCSTLGYDLNDEFFGLGSRPVPAGTTELLVARAMHCHTFGEAIAAFAHAANLVLPDIQVDVKQRLHELHFCMSFPQTCSEAQQILLELTCIPFHSTFRWLTGSPLPVVRFRTARSRPSRATHVLAVFNCGVQFEGTGIDIVYRREAEDLPVVARDLTHWRTDIYSIFLDDLERRRNSFSGSAFASYVEQALRSGVTSQDAIAASACMAVATLRRRLQLERTSFRAISDRVFADLARQQMDSGATIEQVADRVGYSDARSFRRAFRRVFGDNPAGYRGGVLGKISRP